MVKKLLKVNQIMKFNFYVHMPPLNANDNLSGVIMTAFLANL